MLTQHLRVHSLSLWGSEGGLYLWPITFDPQSIALETLGFTLGNIATGLLLFLSVFSKTGFVQDYLFSVSSVLALPCPSPGSGHSHSHQDLVFHSWDWFLMDSLVLWPSNLIGRMVAVILVSGILSV